MEVLSPDDNLSMFCNHQLGLVAPSEGRELYPHVFLSDTNLPKTKIWNLQKWWKMMFLFIWGCFLQIPCVKLCR